MNTVCLYPILTFLIRNLGVQNLSTVRSHRLENGLMVRTATYNLNEISISPIMDILMPIRMCHININ